ncbi:hypothetical protein MPSEU_000729300 [Mayamaea pseudoterrestris]|nr:hypothetical protein MPSEU_000729300 [Mayamaea pseudoterrestris]
MPVLQTPSSSMPTGAKAVLSLPPPSKHRYFMAATMVLLALLFLMTNNWSITANSPIGAVKERTGRIFSSATSPSVKINPSLIRQATVQARELFIQRQDAYRNATRQSTPGTYTMQGRALDESNVRDTWRMRGMGYAYARHAVIFAAILPDQPYTPGWNVVRIFNTVETTQADCAKWTIYVRVNGPEIFAGSAVAVASQIFPGQSCHLEFPFLLLVAGEYEVDARLLLYNGKAPPQGDAVKDLCGAQQSLDTPMDDFPYSTGFLGFKFYTPVESCCEICSREPLCKYWVSPPLSLTSGLLPRWGGCELFFDEPVDSSDHKALSQGLRRRLAENVHIPANESKVHPHFRSIRNMTGVDYYRGKLNVFHGKRHDVETSYFMGCGWSFWHTQTYPCLDASLDDSVPVYSSNRFTLAPLAAAVKPSNDEPKRLCSLTDEYPSDRFTTMTDAGRWVRYPWPDAATCPNVMQSDPNITMFDVMESDPDHPTCWFRDNITVIGLRCTEYCAHREHHFPWQSSIKKEAEHYSKWENYNCNYLELTDTQLQQCVNNRRIGSYVMEGASISGFVQQFMNQRFRHIKLYVPPSANDGEQLVDTNNTQPLKVAFSTLRLPHVLWHWNTSQWRDALAKSAVAGADEIRFFLTSYYYTSEREPYVTVENADLLSKLTQEILVPKGWKMINGFDVSAAFSYEVATQDDGLHMIGNPVKMVVTKLLHYLCKDHLDDT